MSWRVAGSLETLRDQINAAWPDRSRASDGTIGDTAHQAQMSDHNPDAYGVVRALDVTHDPGHGCDIDALSDALIGSHDPRVSYVIANRLISGPLYGWQWADYDGSDPHTNHLHLSVVSDGRADDSSPWNLGGTMTQTIPGAYDDYLPDTAMAILTGQTPRLGYPDATGPAWDNDAIGKHNLAAVEARLNAKLDAISAKVAAPTPLDYAALAAALLAEIAACRP